jgi:hypothetical protein
MSELALPERAADLERYETVPEVMAELQRWARPHGDYRLAVGLLLWRLRTLVTEQQYMDELDKVAQWYDVELRTLRRWRLKAEIAWQLEPPSARAAAVRSREAEAVVTQGVATTATSPHVVHSSAPPEVVTPTEVIPPEPPPEPPPRPRAAPPPPEQLSFPFQERVRALAVEPLDEWITLPDDVFAALEARVAAARRMRRAAVTTASHGANVPARTGPCSHPTGMRLTLAYGTFCHPSRGGCGAKLR